MGTCQLELLSVILTWRSYPIWKACISIPPMVCLMTHHIPELLFFQAWNGSTFDSIAVYSTWCSVIPKTWTADVLFPRNALPIELAKSRRLGFSKVIDCMQSFAEAEQSVKKILVKIHSLCDVNPPALMGSWYLLVSGENSFSWHLNSLFTAPSFWRLWKREAFVAVRPETTVPAVNLKRWVLSFHVKLYWKSSIDGHWLSAQRSNVIL